MADLVDASVVIAIFGREPISAHALDVVNSGALMSSANLVEVATWLARQGDSDQIDHLAEDANLAVVPLTEELALAAGRIEPLTRAFGLSQADRCCLATAEAFDATILTTDRAWLKLPARFRDRIVSVRPDD